MTITYLSSLHWFKYIINGSNGYVICKRYYAPLVVIYLYIVTYTGIMHHYYNEYNKRGCIVNESRRLARYCFECAERGI